jgi:anaerobic selenocysteine-containing dehydrogenase
MRIDQYNMLVSRRSVLKGSTALAAAITMGAGLPRFASAQATAPPSWQSPALARASPPMLIGKRLAACASNQPRPM